MVGATRTGEAGTEGSATFDPVGLFARAGGTDRVTLVLAVTVLWGLEYVELLSLASRGGLGNAKDSEGENGRTDMGVRISPASINPLFETVRY